MPIVKRIVCLANSRKLSGRCIAGPEFADGRTGAWVRPVSAREHEEVSEYERQYQDGSDPKVPDIIDVPLIEPRARTYQQENWLIDDKHYWERSGKATWADLAKLEDAPAPLWINGHSTYNGLNDRIPLADAASLRDSLRLISVPSLELWVSAPGADFGDRRRRVQVRFEYASVRYWLRVSDPDIERGYLAKNDGTYRLAESYLTISLGEPFQGYCYKLAAAVIAR